RRLGDGTERQRRQLGPDPVGRHLDPVPAAWLPPRRPGQRRLPLPQPGARRRGWPAYLGLRQRRRKGADRPGSTSRPRRAAVTLAGRQPAAGFLLTAGICVLDILCKAMASALRAVTT